MTVTWNRTPKNILMTATLAGLCLILFFPCIAVSHHVPFLCLSVSHSIFLLCLCVSRPVFLMCLSVSHLVYLMCLSASQYVSLCGLAVSVVFQFCLSVSHPVYLLCLLCLSCVSACLTLLSCGPVGVRLRPSSVADGEVLLCFPPSAVWPREEPSSSSGSAAPSAEPHDVCE